jgi:hypothetical protein
MSGAVKNTLGLSGAGAACGAVGAALLGLALFVWSPWLRMMLGWEAVAQASVAGAASGAALAPAASWLHGAIARGRGAAKRRGAALARPLH